MVFGAIVNMILLEDLISFFDALNYSIKYLEIPKMLFLGQIGYEQDLLLCQSLFHFIETEAKYK